MNGRSFTHKINFDFNKRYSVASYLMPPPVNSSFRRRRRLQQQQQQHSNQNSFPTGCAIGGMAQHTLDQSIHALQMSTAPERSSAAESFSDVRSFSKNIYCCQAAQGLAKFGDLSAANGDRSSSATGESSGTGEDGSGSAEEGGDGSQGGQSRSRSRSRIPQSKTASLSKSSEIKTVTANSMQEEEQYSDVTTRVHEVCPITFKKAKPIEDNSSIYSLIASHSSMESTSVSASASASALMSSLPSVFSASINKNGCRDNKCECVPPPPPLYGLEQKKDMKEELSSLLADLDSIVFSIENTHTGKAVGNMTEKNRSVEVIFASENANTSLAYAAGDTIEEDDNFVINESISALNELDYGDNEKFGVYLYNQDEENKRHTDAYQSNESVNKKEDAKNESGLGCNSNLSAESNDISSNYQVDKNQTSSMVLLPNINGENRNVEQPKQEVMRLSDNALSSSCSFGAIALDAPSHYNSHQSENNSSNNSKIAAGFNADFNMISNNHLNSFSVTLSSNSNNNNFALNETKLGDASCSNENELHLSASLSPTTDFSKSYAVQSNTLPVLTDNNSNSNTNNNVSNTISNNNESDEMDPTISTFSSTFLGTKLENSNVNGTCNSDLLELPENTHLIPTNVATVYGYSDINHKDDTENKDGCVNGQGYDMASKEGQKPNSLQCKKETFFCLDAANTNSNSNSNNDNNNCYESFISRQQQQQPFEPSVTLRDVMFDCICDGNVTKAQIQYYSILTNTNSINSSMNIHDIGCGCCCNSSKVQSYVASNCSSTSLNIGGPSSDSASRNTCASQNLSSICNNTNSGSADATTSSTTNITTLPLGNFSSNRAGCCCCPISLSSTTIVTNTGTAASPCPVYNIASSSPNRLMTLKLLAANRKPTYRDRTKISLSAIEKGRPIKRKSRKQKENEFYNLRRAIEGDCNASHLEFQALTDVKEENE